jgi:rSAM/selenodomain-associated transferase 2
MPRVSWRFPLPSALTVIVPAWCESALLEEALRPLVGRPGVEVIVAEGGGGDGETERVARLGARVVSTVACRGAQLDAGARAAGSPVLLFLHADCRLPGGFEDAVQSALEDPAVVLGAFSLALDAPGRWFRILERATRWRLALTRTPYGDQGFFLRREDYLASGGFRHWPILEDVDLVRRLRRRGRILILPQPLTASARRYFERGFIRTTLRYRLASLLWSLHVPARTIWMLVGLGQRAASTLPGRG